MLAGIEVSGQGIGQGPLSVGGLCGEDVAVVGPAEVGRIAEFIASAAGVSLSDGGKIASVGVVGAWYGIEFILAAIDGWAEVFDQRHPRFVL